MATIADYFNKAGNSTMTYPVQAVVSQARAAGDTVLTCQSLAGWATDTPVHFSTYNVGSDGAVNVGSQTDWKGIVVNNTITQLTRLRGASDSGNAIGDIVELNPTIGWLDDLITGLLVAHDQSGALKSGSVGASALASSAVTSAKIGSSAVTNAKIASSAITTAKIADNAVTADKIDFTTYSTTEKVVGTWTNGKKIYEKVITDITLDTSTAGATTTVSSVISTGVNAISVDGAAFYTGTTGQEIIPINHSDASIQYSGFALSVRISGGNLQISAVASSSKSWKANVIIRYIGA